MIDGWRWGLAAWVLAALVGCDEAPPPPADAGMDALGCDAPGTWACPAGWVRGASGGCGPAVILCAPDGGAAAGACDGEDLRAPRAFPTDDGGTGWRFGLAVDGAVTGGWSERMPACAEGWTRLDDGSCVPVLRACAAGASPLPGGRCTPTAEGDCSAERFPPRTPEMTGHAVVFVAADAPAAGADGTELHPLRTVAEALPRAGEGGFVLVARGTYADPLTVSQRVTVAGSCAARVTLGDGEGIAARVVGALTLRGVTTRGGVIVPGTLDAEAVHLRAGHWRYALRVETAVGRATLRNVRVEVSGEKGVDAVQSAHLTMSSFAVVGGVGVGVNVEAGTEVTLRDGLVTDMSEGSLTSEGSGAALFVRGSARVDAAQVAFDRCQGFAVNVTDGPGQLVLRGSVIRDTRPGAMGGGKALQVSLGATATLQGIRIERSANTAASAFDGGTLVVEDSVVLDTQERGNGTAGRGLDAHHGAFLRVSRTRIEGMHDVALFSYDRSQTTVRDVLVRRTSLPSGGGFGAGLAVVSLPGKAGTSLDARRVLIEDSHEEGFAAVGVGTDVTLQDVIVLGVRPSGRGFAVGALTTGGAHLEAERVAVVGARGIGFGTQQYALAFRATGTRVDVRDVFVRDVAPGQIVYSVTRPEQPPTGTAAYAVVAGEATELEAERVLIERAGVGLAALSPTTLRDVVVVGAGRDVVVGRSRVSADRVGLRGVTCTADGALRVDPDDTLGDPQVSLSRPP